jgi:TusA-related sulfurtransferase
LHVGKKNPDGHAGKDRSSSTRTDRVLDLRGMIVPLTLLKITQGFRALQGGETLEILGTDQDTRRDALSVLGKSPCKIVCICDEKDHYIIRLRKDQELGGRNIS